MPLCGGVIASGPTRVRGGVRVRRGPVHGSTTRCVVPRAQAAVTAVEIEERTANAKIAGPSVSAAGSVRRRKGVPLDLETRRKMTEAQQKRRAEASRLSLEATERERLDREAAAAASDSTASDDERYRTRVAERVSGGLAAALAARQGGVLSGAAGGAAMAAAEDAAEGAAEEEQDAASPLAFLNPSDKYRKRIAARGGHELVHLLQSRRASSGGEAGSAPLSLHEPPGELTQRQAARFAADLRKFRRLKQALQPWTESFVERHGRRPTRADVAASDIEWLQKTYRDYMLARNKLILEVPHVRGELAVQACDVLGTCKAAQRMTSSTQKEQGGIAGRGRRRERAAAAVMGIDADVAKAR